MPSLVPVEPEQSLVEVPGLQFPVVAVTHKSLAKGVASFWSRAVCSTPLPGGPRDSQLGVQSHVSLKGHQDPCFNSLLEISGSEVLECPMTLRMAP